MQTTAGSAAETPVRVPRSDAVWALSALMVVGSMLLQLSFVELDPPEGIPFSVPFWALGLAFATAEVLVIHLPVRRDAHTISLAEIPLVVGLALAAPAELILGRVLGALFALALIRRQAPIKLAFNLAMFTLETCIALVAYRWILGTQSPNSPIGWLAGLVAVGLAVVWSSTMVDVVIALHDGRRRFAELVRSFAAGSLISISVAFIGLVSLTIVWYDRRAVALLAGLVVLFFFLMRLFGSMSKRHDDLRAVYAFTAELDRSARVADVARATLTQCRSLLRAGHAELVFGSWQRASHRRMAVKMDGRILSDRVDPAAIIPVLSELRGRRRPRTFGGGEAGPWADYFHKRGYAFGLVAPIETADGTVGALAVGNRAGPEKRFSESDAELLDTLARTASVTLERAAALERLTEEIDAKQRVIRSKDELIAAVSHELRTPLTGVLGFAELLMTGDAEDAGRDEMINAIASDAFDLGNIVEDLLVAARDELGVLTVANDHVLLDDVIGSLVESRGSRWASDLSLELDRVTAIGDAQRIRQIVRNLLENAKRYGGDSVRVLVGTEGDRAHVKVLDDGEGIPPEKRETVFAPYSSAHAPGTQPGSVGLGLTLSRRLARRMNGDLTYSYRDGWSVFDFTLPVGAPDIGFRRRLTDVELYGEVAAR